MHWQSLFDFPTATPLFVDTSFEGSNRPTVSAFMLSVHQKTFMWKPSARRCSCWRTAASAERCGHRHRSSKRLRLSQSLIIPSSENSPLLETKVIVIGASAGGVLALQTLVSTLPKPLAAAVIVVMHIPIHTATALHQILTKAGPNPAKLAQDGEEIEQGVIYIAPNDHHVVVDDDRLRLTRGPRENRARPCIDVLFRSAALAFGPRVIGVVLTGALDDGTAGLWAIKDRGGVAVVQDPADAEWPSMPQNAINHVSVDHVLPLRLIGRTLVELTQSTISAEPPRTSVARRMEFEVQIAIEGNALKRGVMNMGEHSANTCPECHGVLVKIQEGSVIRFRCHTGHAFSLQTLLVDVDKCVDESLWNAIRAIEERALVLNEMKRAAEACNDIDLAKECAAQAEGAAERAQRIRNLVVDPQAAAATCRITSRGNVPPSGGVEMDS
jgi:two-component system chemotaxis response regulator CheB